MKFIVFACLMLCLSSCGYHFPNQGGALPGGVEKVYVPLLVNKTSEPQLETLLSNRITEVMSRSSKVSLVEDRALAEAELLGLISSYQTRALSYDKNDDIGEYRASMTVEASLRQASDGKLLWQGQVSWHDEYSAAGDKTTQEDLEQDAIEEISLRLAEELLSRLLDDF